MKNYCECPFEKDQGPSMHAANDCRSHKDYLHLVEREGQKITVCSNCTMPGDIRLDE